MTRRLLTHLAQFSSFSKQGELLCTQGLAYLLGNREAHAAFTMLMSLKVEASFKDEAAQSIRLGVPLTWRAEARQADRGRPDLEACDGDARPVVKIEAKLGAEFGGGQLRSYIADFQRRNCAGLLVVLVPRRRVSEICASTAKDLACTGTGPWRVGNEAECAVLVMSWEELLDAFKAISSEPFAGDLAQFEGMYLGLNGDVIEPVTDRDLLAWRDREQVFVNLVDRVTRILSPNADVMPMGLESKSYRRRYVCRRIDTRHSCFSVGVRDPFVNYRTPIWMRFNRGTAMFATIKARLTSSPLSSRLVESGGHLWIPLDIPLDGSDGTALLENLVRQAGDVVDVAYPPA